MSDSKKIIILCLVIAVPMLHTGCVHGTSPDCSPSFPEEIQIEPRGNATIRGLNVCIFAFTEPDFAPGMGLAAAESLRSELLKNGVFEKIALNPDKKALDESGLIEFAATGRYDLIILGDLLYYFDGGNSLASRVDERIEIIAPRSKRPEILWRARAAEISKPVASGDHVFYRSRGGQAKSASTLLRKNATKFCNMIKHRSNRNVTRRDG